MDIITDLWNGTYDVNWEIKTDEELTIEEFIQVRENAAFDRALEEKFPEIKETVYNILD